MSTLAEQVVEQLKTDMDNVYDAGYQKGKSEGGDSYYDTFWDVYQEYGKRINYKYAFNSFWNDENFKPKYDIVPKDGSYLINYSTITDLKALLEKQGVVLDMSQATTCYCAFEGNKAWTSFPCIDISSCTNFGWAFGYNTKLETIEEIKGIQPACTWSQSFQDCTNLKNIKLTGSIGKSISFGHSQYLTDESIQNIIDVLMDKTGQTATVLTLHNNVKAKLTEEQIATITSKNWTLA